MDTAGRIHFMFVLESGKEREAFLLPYPRAHVVDIVHFTNDYWVEDDQTRLFAQYTAGKIKFAVCMNQDDKADQRLYPERGYHVVTDGIWFVDLEAMAQFFRVNMRDPIAEEIWPDKTEIVRRECMVKPKPWQLLLPPDWP